MGLLFFAIIIALAWGAARVLSSAASVVYDRVNPSQGSPSSRTANPNANNPDALEADLDPEGDEPEGY